MRPDQLKAELIRLRQLAIRCSDEADWHRGLGREMLAQKLEGERRRVETEAGYVVRALQEQGNDDARSN